ncbi:hypothetical protein [Cellulophaga baltica]|uniref:hypothetical protein n=1 Tax=Cellulophaga baltica TaxID=76594 RepID=UPI002494D0F4|nr:hypothetical protein [Cellulophaga baltica]
MREIFQYYLTNCYQAIIHEKELTFDFGDYAIVFYFVNNKSFVNEQEIDYEEPFSYYSINGFKEIEVLLERNVSFESCNFKGYENLGWREDIEDGRSITNEMYYFIKKIENIKEGIINNFSIDVVFTDSMCDKYGNYQFTINIIDDYFFNIEFAKNIINIIKLYKQEIPSFYTVFFRKRVDIFDNKKIPILTTNTKVRRLGYFKILSKFLLDYKKIPSTFVNKKFENYCLDYKHSLENNLYTKGLIGETKSGISAKPYVDAASELELVSKINNAYHTSKSFKVYQVLQEKYSISSNVFELSDFDKMYFLEKILRNDFFYFTNLLELIFIKENVTYSYVINKYQSQLTSRLNKYRHERKNSNNLEAILNRIKSWEKPTIYLEHLVMPRINWMLDLGLLTENNKRFSITEIGMRLFENISVWNDINTDKIISPDSFLDRFMVHIFDDCYNSSKNNKPLEIDFVLGKMYGYIKQSFNLFKTLAPNRVTVSQAANYTKYMLYLNDNISVGYEFILNKLSEQDKFIFKYQEQYKDGYIQLKK